MRNALIVGGLGKVGQWFIKLIAHSSFHATILDVQEINKPSSLFISGDLLDGNQSTISILKNSDLVVLAVPENVALESVKFLKKHMKPQAVLVDTLSVKSRFYDALCEVEFSGEALGLQPLFKPGMPTKDNSIAIVRYCDGTKVAELVEIVQKSGANIVEFDPVSHDKAMSILQVSTHAIILSFGLLLKNNQIDITTFEKIGTPPFKTLLALVARIADGTPDVYWDIQKNNPFSAMIRQSYEQSFNTLNEIVIDQGEQAFTQMMKDVCNCFGNRLESNKEQCEAMFAAITEHSIDH